MTSNQPSTITNNVPIGWKNLKTMLVNQYGIEFVHLTRQLEKEYLKLASIRNHICFLKNCHRYGLISKSIHLKSPVTSKKIEKILKKASHHIVKEMKNIQYSKLDQTEDTIKQTEVHILETCFNHKTLILSFLDYSYDKKFEEIKRNQIKKLDSLLSKQLECTKQLKSGINASNKFVVNISSYPIGKFY